MRVLWASVIVMTTSLGALAAAGDSIGDLEHVQRLLGRLSQSHAEGFENLADEYRMNFGRQKERRSRRKAEKLRSLSTGDAPLAAEYLRAAATSDRRAAVRNLEAAAQAQRRILAKIEALTRTNAPSPGASFPNMAQPDGSNRARQAAAAPAAAARRNQPRGDDEKRLEQALESIEKTLSQVAEDAEEMARRKKKTDNPPTRTPSQAGTGRNDGGRNSGGRNSGGRKPPPSDTENTRTGPPASAGDSSPSSPSSTSQARRKVVSRMLSASRDLARQIEKADRAVAEDQMSPETKERLDEARETAKALEKARDASRLANEQRRLSRRLEKTPGGGNQTRTSRQERALAGRARTISARLEADNPEPADSALEAAEAMEAAAKLISEGKALEARRAMAEATEQLEETAGSILASLAQGDEGRGGGGGGEARPKTGPRTGRPRAPAGANAPAPHGKEGARQAWLARLGPQAPPEILQAAQGTFPRGYEGALRKYYETLAEKETSR